MLRRAVLPRAALPLAFLFIACGKAPPASVTPAAQGTPETTVMGNKFVAPSGWAVSVRGPATIPGVPAARPRGLCLPECMSP